MGGGGGGGGGVELGRRYTKVKKENIGFMSYSPGGAATLGRAAICWKGRYLAQTCAIRHDGVWKRPPNDAVFEVFVACFVKPVVFFFFFFFC